MTYPARMLRALLLFSLLLLPGCISGATRSVTMRVTAPDGSPVPNAQVYAVVLGRSPVPLPIDAETISEVLTKESISGWTDSDGEVRLELDEDEGHVIFLRPPPVGPYALGPGEAGAYRYLLDAGEGLRADPVGGGEPPLLKLETVR